MVVGLNFQMPDEHGLAYREIFLGGEERGRLENRVDRTQYFDAVEDIFDILQTLPDPTLIFYVTEQLFARGKISRSEKETLEEWNCFDGR